jgi:hypothetical protein
MFGIWLLFLRRKGIFSTLCPRLTLCGLFGLFAGVDVAADDLQVGFADFESVRGVSPPVCRMTAKRRPRPRTGHPACAEAARPSLRLSKRSLNPGSGGSDRSDPCQRYRRQTQVEQENARRGKKS